MRGRRRRGRRTLTLTREILCLLETLSSDGTLRTWLDLAPSWASPLVMPPERGGETGGTMQQWGIAEQMA
jgi:hypothetical protein